MHMGNHHGAASAGGWWWLNKVHGACMDLIGGSSVIWKFDHNIAHHCHSNELGKDNDCEIGNPVLRFHPELPRQWFHSFQVFSSWPLFESLYLVMHWSDSNDKKRTMVLHTVLVMNIFSSLVPCTRMRTISCLDRP
jgi:fatty acid desaturase (delta-4 desaturase)